jgi:hypothetical protein
MKQAFKIIYIFITFSFLIYLLLPLSNFPDRQDGSLQSSEPADIETQLRRGYYANSDRESVINYYQNEFGKTRLFGRELNLFSIRLNYPPEESQTLIRDQNRSTYLEEIVHPFRQSLFISGFEPKYDKDRIVVDGTNYQQKLVIKLVVSNVFTRVLIGMLSMVLLYFNIKMWVNLMANLKKPSLTGVSKVTN